MVTSPNFITRATRKQALEQTGYRVIVHAWYFEPGDNFVARMRDALEHADRALALGLGRPVGLPIVGHACGRR